MKRRQVRSNEAIEFAKAQRQTANEFASTVWQWLRNRQCCGPKFGREFPIPPYTVDFCCVDLRLVIEVDGDAHLTRDGVERDRQRDKFLADRGYQVLRIAGYEVIRDGAAVIERMRVFVAAAMDQTTKSPSPPSPLSPQRGEGEPEC